MLWGEQERAVRAMLNLAFGDSKPMAAAIGMPYGTYRMQVDAHMTKALSLRAFWLQQRMTRNWEALRYLCGQDGMRLLAAESAEAAPRSLFQGLTRVGTELGHLCTAVEQAQADESPGGAIILAEELSLIERMANRLHGQVDAVMFGARMIHEEQQERREA